MNQGQFCYVCGKPTDSREHIPPRSFFPRGGGLQLKTVPSCAEHNNAKSNDDQYVLAHICMNAAAGDTLPRQVFLRSIAPQLSRSPAFHTSLAEGSVTLPNGARKYIVDTARFDNFFDHLCAGFFFDRYGFALDPEKHAIRHVYLEFGTDDPAEQNARRMLASMLGHLLAGFQSAVAHYEADKLDDIVYMNRVMDPAGAEGSITIVHTFYGVFDVVSLLTRRLAGACRSTPTLGLPNAY